MTRAALVEVTGLSVDAPGGRPLFRDLCLSLGHEQVALVGRNGVGKSTLLHALAGGELPERGRIVRRGTLALVPQELTRTLGATRLSPGELRKRHLKRAFDANPDLLLLDEPTLDLDEDGMTWLTGALETWSRGLLVVSHDRRLLGRFQHFFLVAESGCRLVSGSFEKLLDTLEREGAEREREYVRNLNRLVEREKRNAALGRRRQRKKNVGRIRELARGPSRALLNTNRSYAQESQGRRAVLQQERILATRDWAKATRRALSVALPLELAVPELPDDGGPVVALCEVTARVGAQTLFDALDLTLGRERLAILGPNGAGKSTLFRIMMGERPPVRGDVTVRREKVGYVAQNAENWQLEDSLLSRLAVESEAASVDELARLLSAHRFPFALAERPLRTLSPGERVRAALICLFRRRPTVECLLLDEPTHDLDFLATRVLEGVLRAWRGGLVVTSHDPSFLAAIGVERHLFLGAQQPDSEPVQVGAGGLAGAARNVATTG